MMRNAEVAEALHELADYSQVQGETWEARAYRRAARTIEELTEAIEAIHEQGELTEIEGIGQAIAEKIADLLETGTMHALETVRDEVPIDVPGLLRVQGLGAKSIAKLHDALGIEDLDDLEAAAQAGRITEVKGFGQKTQQGILEQIQFVRQASQRTLLHRADRAAEALTEQLEATGAFETLALAGSLRRRCPTVGDLDLLATAQRPADALDAFTSLDGIRTVISHGDQRATIILADGLQADLHVIEPDAWGSGLVHFTGSKDHNVELRRRAQDRGLHLSEHGLEEDGDPIALATEEEVYGALGLTWIAPEMREGMGEVQAAADDQLPELLELSDMRGDLQMHTTWSDGKESIVAMAEKGQALGYEYILITDHGPSLTVAGGPSPDELPEQREEVEAANDAVDLTVLQGIEANITSQGMDVAPEVCQELDLVLASLHDTVADATDRVVHALEDYPVDIFAHPTNRLLGQREGNDLDMEAVLEACKANQVAVEINAQPNRLDLDWRLVHRYKDEVPFVISTDAHSPDGMELMGCGVDQARKAGLTTEHVLNAQPLDALLEAVGR